MSFIFYVWPLQKITWHIFPGSGWLYLPNDRTHVFLFHIKAMYQSVFEKPQRIQIFNQTTQFPTDIINLIESYLPCGFQSKYMDILELESIIFDENTKFGTDDLR